MFHLFFLRISKKEIRAFFPGTSEGRLKRPSKFLLVQDTGTR